MRQYQVPQFIMVEDKIIGPLTMKQAIYIAAGVALILFARWILAQFLFVPIALVIAAAAAALAFVKVNEQPLPWIAKNAIAYLLRPHVYIWRPGERKHASPKAAPRAESEGVRVIPRMSQSKLSDLAWSLDIKAERHE